MHVAQNFPTIESYESRKFFFQMSVVISACCDKKDLKEKIELRHLRKS